MRMTKTVKTDTTEKDITEKDITEIATTKAKSKSSGKNNNVLAVSKSIVSFEYIEGQLVIKIKNQNRSRGKRKKGKRDKRDKRGKEKKEDGINDIEITFIFDDPSPLLAYATGKGQIELESVREFVYWITHNTSQSSDPIKGKKKR